MRATPVLLAALVLALPACASIESVSKPSPEPSPPSVPVVRPRPAPPPLPPLQPQLTEAEERRLRDAATRQIADAERAIRGVQAETLQPGERETFGTIQSFLQQARQALTARDYDRATTLARKAETLAQDLPQSPR